MIKFIEGGNWEKYIYINIHRRTILKKIEKCLSSQFILYRMSPNWIKLHVAKCLIIIIIFAKLCAKPCVFIPSGKPQPEPWSQCFCTHSSQAKALRPRNVLQQDLGHIATKRQSQDPKAGLSDPKELRLTYCHLLYSVMEPFPEGPMLTCSLPSRLFLGTTL